MISHTHDQSLFAWRDGRAITAGAFLADVAALCALLPAGGHMLNACADRYHFAVGLAAALQSAKVCLLPSTQAPEMISQLARFAPDAFCLTDNPACIVDLPQTRYPASPAATSLANDDAGNRCPQSQVAPFSVPRIDSAQLAAYVFTSGSTGVPMPHPKTWGALVRNVHAEAQLCRLDEARLFAIIGTVPAQHMYGFESSVLLAMQSANALVAGNAFYPADICNTLCSVPHPRVLVSTPVHLRSLLSSVQEVPPVDLLLSATAPLSQALASEAEARFCAPLLEIYGSTETGQIAARATARSDVWELFPGVSLTLRQDATWASGGHIEQPTVLNDVIELLADGQHFRLHGRNADLINIAGKRNSLAYLDLQLNAIDGVEDGAFYMPDGELPGHVTRLMAFVVAPTLAPADLLEALRQKFDLVFLPRPLVYLDALPRNGTGKLPRQALKALADQHMNRHLS
ncbi:MAG: AMP-binding protein [Janthinobacterium lividum]